MSTQNGRTGTSYKNNVKYLGFILNRGLYWIDHLEYKCGKKMVSLWQTRRAIRKNWRLRPETMRRIYEAVLKLRLTHVSLVWWNRTIFSAAKHDLECTRAMILKSIIMTMKTIFPLLWEP